MDQTQNIRLLDSIYVFLTQYHKGMDWTYDRKKMWEAISVLVQVREGLAEGTPMKTVLSSKEEMLDALLKTSVSPLPARDAAEEILRDLREGGEL